MNRDLRLVHVCVVRMSILKTVTPVFDKFSTKRRGNKDMCPRECDLSENEFLGNSTKRLENKVVG